MLKPRENPRIFPADAISAARGNPPPPPPPGADEGPAWAPEAAHSGCPLDPFSAMNRL